MSYLHKSNVLHILTNCTYDCKFDAYLIEHKFFTFAASHWLSARHLLHDKVEARPRAVPISAEALSGSEIVSSDGAKEHPFIIGLIIRAYHYVDYKGCQARVSGNFIPADAVSSRISWRNR